MDGSESPLSVSRVPQDRLAEVWPLASQLLEPAAAVSNGRYVVGDALEAVEKGDDELWIIHRGPKVYAALTVTIMTYPQIRALLVKFCGGGGLEAWTDALDDALVAGAKSAGCQKIEWVGRAGWVRVARNYGYRPVYVTVEKDIPHA